MTTRALRGWTLGNPFAQHEKEGKPWRRCECSYVSPYLHSLVVKWFHWDGPIMRLPDTREKAVEMVKEQGLEPRELIDERARRDNVIRHQEGHWLWRMDQGDHAYHGGGGYYSYNPPHISRMGRWEQVGVLGVVTLFGEIAVHERGYRSEGVRIDKLWVLQEASVRRSARQTQRHLEETYRCDVVMLKKMLYEGFQDWLEREDVENLL